MKRALFFLLITLITLSQQLIAQQLLVEGKVMDKNGKDLSFSEKGNVNGSFQLLLLNENGHPKTPEDPFSKISGKGGVFAKVNLAEAELKNFRIKIMAMGYSSRTYNMAVPSSAVKVLDPKTYVLNLSILFRSRRLKPSEEVSLTPPRPQKTDSPSPTSPEPFDLILVHLKVHELGQAQKPIKGAEIVFLEKKYITDTEGECKIAISPDSVSHITSEPLIEVKANGYEDMQSISGLLTLLKFPAYSISSEEVIIQDLALRKKGTIEFRFSVKEESNERPIEKAIIRILTPVNTNIQSTETDTYGNAILHLGEDFIKQNQNWLSIEVLSPGIDTVRKWLEVREEELHSGKILKKETIFLERDKPLKMVKLSGFLYTKWNLNRPISLVSLHLNSPQIEIGTSAITNEQGQFTFYLPDSLFSLRNGLELSILSLENGYKETRFDVINIDEGQAHLIQKDGRYFLGDLTLKMDEPTPWTLMLPGLNPLLRKRLYKPQTYRTRENQSLTGWALMGGFAVSSSITGYRMYKSREYWHKHINTNSQLEANAYFDEYQKWQRRSIIGLGAVGLTYGLQTLDYFIWRGRHRDRLIYRSSQLSFGGTPTLPERNLAVAGPQLRYLTLAWTF